MPSRGATPLSPSHTTAQFALDRAVEPVTLPPDLQPHTGLAESEEPVLLVDGQVSSLAFRLDEEDGFTDELTPSLDEQSSFIGNANWWSDRLVIPPLQRHERRSDRCKSCWGSVVALCEVALTNV